jgi:hypothetical protein
MNAARVVIGEAASELAAERAALNGDAVGLVTCVATRGKCV